MAAAGWQAENGMKNETVEMWIRIEPRVAKFVSGPKGPFNFEDQREVLLEIRLLFLAGDQGVKYNENQAVGHCEKHLFKQALERLGLVAHEYRVGKRGTNSDSITFTYVSIDAMLATGWEPAVEEDSELGIADERSLFFESPQVPEDDKEMALELERGTKIKDVAAKRGIDPTTVPWRLKRDRRMIEKVYKLAA